MKTRLLTLALLASPAFSLAQEAGHASVPSGGPAARERSARTAEDDLTVQVERLRRDLAELAKRYRKAEGDERSALARRAMPLLDRMASDLRDLSERKNSGNPQPEPLARSGAPR